MGNEAEKEEDDGECEVAQRSELSQDISELKSAITKVAKEREQLPQPMFWSLFKSRIDDFRQRKGAERALQDIFENPEDD